MNLDLFLYHRDAKKVTREQKLEETSSRLREEARSKSALWTGRSKYVLLCKIQNAKNVLDEYIMLSNHVRNSNE